MHTHTRTNIEAVVVTLQLLRPIALLPGSTCGNSIYSSGCGVSSLVSVPSRPPLVWAKTMGSASK